MEVLRTASMYILGIGMFIAGVKGIKENAKKPLLVMLCCFAMSVGLIGYILLSKLLFLVIGLVGLILILILG